MTIFSLKLYKLKYNILVAIDQVSGRRGDQVSHFVKRRWDIDDSSGLGRCYLVLSLLHLEMTFTHSTLRAAPLYDEEAESTSIDNIDLNQMSHRYASGALQNDWKWQKGLEKLCEIFES